MKILNIFLLLILPLQKTRSLINFVFIWIWVRFFHCMLFCLHCIIKICWYMCSATIINNFNINWLNRNCLKSWRVTYLNIICEHCFVAYTSKYVKQLNLRYAVLFEFCNDTAIVKIFIKLNFDLSCNTFASTITVQNE